MKRLHRLQGCRCSLPRATAPLTRHTFKHVENRKHPSMQPVIIPAAAQVSTVIAPAADVSTVTDASTFLLREKVARLGALGLSIGPSALLFPYYIGVLSGLVDLSVDQSELVISGCSGGALIGALAVSGMQPEEILRANVDMYNGLQQEGTFQKVHNALYRVMKDELPWDAHLKASGRLGVLVTQLKPQFQGYVVEDFGSRSDLIDAVCTSCYIPFWSGPTLGLPFRGALCCDGLSSGWFPGMPLAAAGRIDAVVKVCCIPSPLPQAADISPALAPGRYSALHYMTQGLSCNPQSVMQYYINGRDDVATWASRL